MEQNPKIMTHNTYRPIPWAQLVAIKGLLYYTRIYLFVYKDFSRFQVMKIDGDFLYLY